MALPGLSGLPAPLAMEPYLRPEPSFPLPLAWPERPCHLRSEALAKAAAETLLQTVPAMPSLLPEMEPSALPQTCPPSFPLPGESPGGGAADRQRLSEPDGHSRPPGAGGAVFHHAPASASYRCGSSAGGTQRRSFSFSALPLPHYPSKTALPALLSALPPFQALSALPSGPPRKASSAPSPCPPR